jgi:hypothetical protein
MPPGVQAFLIEDADAEVKRQIADIEHLVCGFGSVDAQ